MPIKAQQKYAGASVMAKDRVDGIPEKRAVRPPVKIRIKSKPDSFYKEKEFLSPGAPAFVVVKSDK